jgi:hypothetical protein
MQIRLAVARKSTRPRAIEIAIRDECTDTRKAQLATMCVPGNDQSTTICGHGIKYAQIRCV